jgi:hypothetical protein
MKVFMYVVIFIVAVLILAAINVSYETEIKEWATENGKKVESIERCHFLTGPYYVSKSCHIYKVKANDGVYWFRYGLFYDDIEKEKSDGDYVKIR